MRRSEFLRAVDSEFGDRAMSLTHDLVLGSIGMTALDALDAGIPPREIWLALCEDMDVPLNHRHGAGQLDPPRR